ncbi:MAG: hypothetical protein Q9213_004912, partial [Squamulea squamosa]
MPITISPATTADISHIFSIISSTFQHTSLAVDAIYPYHDNPIGAVAGTFALLHEFKDDPRARFFKAVDTETDTIIGHANWTLYDDDISVLERPELEGERWGSKEEKDFAVVMFGQIMEQRWEAVEKSNGKIL